MIESADWLCEQHFGKNLIDGGVNILDPATGTGTFVCELLNHFRGQPQKLHHKYKEEIFANEVAILPYYVANLNIEATYAEISGQYAEFQNLCFVDTLDNVAGLGKFSGYQGDIFGAVSEENVARIKRQNERKISIVIGNPPYNANQQNENDNNKNRTYKRIDERIKATYIKESTAQKTKLYDMYARFFRWASDRIKDDGIVAFITNRSFIDTLTFDGFRKIVAREFGEIRVVDLGGDWKQTGVGGGGNVFGIGTGVAVSFLIKSKNAKGPARIFYSSLPASQSAEDKLAFLAAHPLSSFKPMRIKPNARGGWIDQGEAGFSDFIPIASKSVKTGMVGAGERAIFKLFSLGVVTNRDDWVWDFSHHQLNQKLGYFIKRFNLQVGRQPQNTNTVAEELDHSIKWTRLLKNHLRLKTRLKFADEKIINALWRPFCRKNLYFDKVLNEMHYQLDSIYRGESVASILISVGARGAGSCLATSQLPSLDAFLPDACCVLARSRLASDGSRHDNITDWALAQFRAHYEAGAILSPAKREKKRAPETRAITKDDIFHYVYGVLHDPLYREKYAQNLKREFPRIPFYPDFFRWTEWGAALMALHIGYEGVEHWPLKRLDMRDEKSAKAGQAPKTILKADREHGIIILDSETQLSGVPQEAWDYRLGNRCALDWILDQHKEKTPKDPTIREKFNTYRFADHKEKVIDLLMRVTRVSVETVRITQAMAQEPRV